MNTHQLYEENLMKTKQLPSPCVVQSVTYTPERRIITFSRIAPHPDYARQPVRRRKGPIRLHLTMAPEAVSSFEPVIQVRSQTKS